VYSIAQSITAKYPGAPALVERIKNASFSDIDLLKPIQVFDRVIDALGQKGEQPG
jgi:hypothetical protein